jgi:hypothetical protein
MIPFDPRARLGHERVRTVDSSQLTRLFVRKELFFMGAGETASSAVSSFLVTAQS